VAVICLTSYLGYVALTSRQTSGPVHTGNVEMTPVIQNGSIPGSPGGKAIDPPNIGATTPVNDSVNVPDKAEAKAKGPELDQSTSQSAQRSKNDRSTAAKAPGTPGADAPAKTRDEDVADVTRSGNVVADLRLKEVKKVYIEMRGDAAFNQLRSNLVNSLGSSGVVTIATDAEEADAALKIVMSQTSAGGPQVESALLVNARGTVLWPKAGRSARRYSGETAKVLSEIVKDLLSEIRLARAGH
jgi:hypothetical protein